MFDWRRRLENVRALPRHEKESFAVSAAVVSMVVVGGGWSYFFVQGLASSQPLQVASVANSLPALPAPPATVFPQSAQAGHDQSDATDTPTQQ